MAVHISDPPCDTAQLAVSAHKSPRMEISRDAEEHWQSVKGKLTKYLSHEHLAPARATSPSLSRAWQAEIRCHLKLWLGYKVLFSIHSLMEHGEPVISFYLMLLKKPQSMCEAQCGHKSYAALQVPVGTSCCK